MTTTEEYAQKHLEENRHHYWSGARVYWIHRWRNDESIRLVKALFDLVWEEIPWHYSK